MTANSNTALRLVAFLKRCAAPYPTTGNTIHEMNGKYDHSFSLMKSPIPVSSQLLPVVKLSNPTAPFTAKQAITSSERREEVNINSENRGSDFPYCAECRGV